MKNIALLVAAFAFLALTPARAQQPAPAWSADLSEIRKVSAMIPGAKPLRVNVIKFAESRRTKNFSVKGAPKDPSIQARTAFQIVYRDGTVMLDTGMDLQVHKFFGRGVEEPYFPDQAKEVERAVRAAKSIILTHEHGDHVGGIVRSPFFAELAAKTVITKTQMQTLLTEPQMPEIKLTQDQAKRFIVIDFEKYYPFAPGIALLKAPGHTPGSQMVYVALESGKELVLAGDVSWHMDGVRTVTGKDAPWIVEDEAAIKGELTWLNLLTKTEANVTVVLAHDEEQRLDYINRKILGDRLE